MIHVLLVDDHEIVRRGIRNILTDSSRDYTISEAATAAEALERLERCVFSLVILDISLPDRSGLDVLRSIASLYPGLPVLVVSAHSEAQFAVRALREGAAGYLEKSTAPEELLLAVGRILLGERFMRASLAERLANDFLGRHQSLHDRLTRREFEIMCLIAAGRRPSEIAAQLFLSVKTVNTHRAHIMSKMAFRTNADLVQYAVRFGLTN